MAEGLRKGALVTMAGNRPGWAGTVVRVARDGSWADVDWGAWTKRHRDPSQLIPLAVLVADPVPFE